MRTIKPIQFNVLKRARRKGSKLNPSDGSLRRSYSKIFHFKMTIMEESKQIRMMKVPQQWPWWARRKCQVSQIIIRIRSRAWNQCRIWQRYLRWRTRSTSSRNETRSIGPRYCPRDEAETKRTWAIWGSLTKFLTISESASTPFRSRRRPM